jgi:molecular chaperone DnaJ
LCKYSLLRAFNRNNLLLHMLFIFSTMTMNLLALWDAFITNAIFAFFFQQVTMQIKDYYTTLEITPLATALQIKKAFRRLALLHHPDKNLGNAVSAALFREIQEAYEVLSDPQKRETYNYKRWYNRTIKEDFVKEALTPADILNECIRLNRYLQSVNALRVDYDGLSLHIRSILSNKNIAILLEYNAAEVNTSIVQKMIIPAAILPFRYIESIATLLFRIAGSNEMLTAEIAIFVVRQKQKESWNKYKPVLVLAITLVICWVIYRVSK